MIPYVFFSSLIFKIQRYFDLPREKSSVNPIKWWSTKKGDFPNLYLMAMDFLAIPGSAVPSERLFSVAGDVISSKRNRLKPETARALVCLESWTAPNGLYPFKPIVPLGQNSKDSKVRRRKRRQLSAVEEDEDNLL